MCVSAGFALSALDEALGIVGPYSGHDGNQDLETLHLQGFCDCTRRMYHVCNIILI